jgi:hypothetical protein
MHQQSARRETCFAFTVLCVRNDPEPSDCTQDTLCLCQSSVRTCGYTATVAVVCCEVGLRNGVAWPITIFGFPPRRKRISRAAMAGNPDENHKGIFLCHESVLRDMTNVHVTLAPVAAALTSSLSDAASSSFSETKLSNPKIERTTPARSNQPPLSPLSLSMDPLPDRFRDIQMSQANFVVALALDAPPLTLPGPINATSRLRLLEVKHQLPDEQIARFLSFTGRRQVLNALIEVHSHYGLLLHTLFVAMNILDRYLSLFERPDELERLELIGLSALFIAAKFVERRFSPSLVRFARAYRLYGSSGRVGSDDDNPLILIELKICESLQFFVDPPTITTFLSPYLPLLRRSHQQMPTLVVQVLYYLAERVLADSSMLFFVPSLIAATLVRLVRRSFASMARVAVRAGAVTGVSVWPEEYMTLSGYHEVSLETCEETIKICLANQPMGSQLRKKYDHSPEIVSCPLVFQPRSFPPLGQDSHRDQDQEEQAA